LRDRAAERAGGARPGDGAPVGRNGPVPPGRAREVPRGRSQACMGGSGAPVRKDPSMTAASPTPPAARLSDLDALLVSRIEEVTSAELSERRAQLGRISTESAALVDDLEAFLEGGKLLRPRFCFWGGVAALRREPTAEEVEAL